MHKQTFTHKLFRQRGFLSYLLPLFALFVGLGSSQSVLAQNTNVASSNVTLNVRGATFNYNTRPAAANANTFNQRNFGQFNVGTDVFTFNGAEIKLEEDPSVGRVFNRAQFRFRIFPGDLNTAANQNNPVFTDIELTDNGPAVGGVHTFSLTGAALNLLNTVAGSNAGTSYRFDVRYRAYQTNNVILDTPIRESVFTAVTPAPAVSSATLRNVVVTSGTTAANATTNTYDATTTTPGPNVFNGTNFGSLNVANGRLLLQGGTIQIIERNGDTFDKAEIAYVVTPGDLNSANASFPAGQTLPLTVVSYDAATKTRTFTLSNAGRSILALAATAGTPGTSYRFDIAVSATGLNSGGDPITLSGALRQRSVFTATGIPSTATLAANTITLDPNGVPPAPPATVPPTPTPPNSDITVYNINPSTPTPFQGANLGTYDVNNGQLLLNNTSVTTTEAGSNTINSVILYYRTRLVGTGGGAFQPITLTQSGNTTGGTRTFIIDPSAPGNSIPQPNLVATPAVTAPGNYVLEIYYQANGFNSATGTNFTLTDPPTANSYYTANFTVNGSLVAQTIWTGGKNDNWFDAANWTNGVPNENVNALVRDLGAGVAVPYPNINSDVDVFAAGINGVFRYSNIGSGPAKARDLIMGGASQAARSITRLVQGQLKVYGNFGNTFDSFIQRENTIMEFAGSDQNISGGSFVRVDISGGGTKSLNGIMNVSESLNFLTGTTTGDTPAVTNPYTPVNANAGILATDIKRPDASVVILSDRSTFNANNGAQLTGETDASFLFGFVRTSRQAVLTDETRTYGNMGMTLTFRINAPGNVIVTRNTVEAYSPLSNNFGIRRIFGIRPSDPATNLGGLVADMVFRYRDSETVNLNGPTLATPGTGSIPEERLTIFVSDNSGNTFGLVGRDGPPNTTANTVTKTGYRGTFATFTLGDTDRPLPVRLTAFDAKRIGNDALITWQTANEINSKGYEVQVSTNGTEFRTLGFVGSASPNSTRLLSYSYVDKEANKTGTRYYRLRQIDIDNKDEYFAPKTVNFDGKASLATLVAYPNPFNSNDELHVAAQLSKGGKGQLRVTDMMGRTIRQESVELASGLADVTVGGMKELKAGTYLVRLTLPTGETQNLKVVKQ